MEKTRGIRGHKEDDARGQRKLFPINVISHIVKRENQGASAMSVRSRGGKIMEKHQDIIGERKTIRETLSGKEIFGFAERFSREHKLRDLIFHNDQLESDFAKKREKFDKNRVKIA